MNHLQGIIIGYCPDLKANWPGYDFTCKTMLRVLREHPDIASMAELSDAELLGKVKKFSRDAVCEFEALEIRDAIYSIEMLDARLAGKERLIKITLAGAYVARRIMLLPGISTTVASTIIGEAGDISRFVNEYENSSSITVEKLQPLYQDYHIIYGRKHWDKKGMIWSP